MVVGGRVSYLEDLGGRKRCILSPPLNVTQKTKVSPPFSRFIFFVPFSSSICLFLPPSSTNRLAAFSQSASVFHLIYFFTSSTVRPPAHGTLLPTTTPHAPIPSHPNPTQTKKQKLQRESSQSYVQNTIPPHTHTRTHTPTTQQPKHTVHRGDCSLTRFVSLAREVQTCARAVSRAMVKRPSQNLTPPPLPNFLPPSPSPPPPLPVLFLPFYLCCYRYGIAHRLHPFFTHSPRPPLTPLYYHAPSLTTSIVL